MHRLPIQPFVLFLFAVLAVPAAHASPPAVAGAVGADPVGAASTSSTLSDGVQWDGMRSSSEQALKRLLQTSPGAHASWRPGQTGPSLVTGLREATEGTTAAARARAFLERFPTLVGVSGPNLVEEETRTAAGRSIVTFRQRHQATEVWGRSVAVTLDDAGRVLTVSNDLQPILVVAKGTVSLETAKATAMAAVSAAGASAGRRVIVVGPVGAFEAAAFSAAPRGTFEAREVVVSLVDGRVTSIRDAIQH